MRPMLATPTDRVPGGEEWLHEVKWDGVRILLDARSERVRFRLDNSGLAPNGVGQDRSTPVVLTANYEPNPAVSLTGFVGAEFNGSLKLENATGTVISHQSYDTAPIAGFAFRLRF